MTVSSVTVGGSSPDFTDVTDFLDAVPDNLDMIYQAKIRSGIYGDNYVVSSTNRGDWGDEGSGSAIHLVAEDRHDGVINSGVRFNPSGTGTCLDIYNPHTVIDGIEFIGAASDDDAIRIRNFELGSNTSSAPVHFRNCIIRDHTGTNAEGILIGGSTRATINLTNTILSNNTRSAIYVVATANFVAIVLNLKNCTFYDNGKSSFAGITIRSTQAATNWNVSAENCLFHSTAGSSIGEFGGATGTRVWNLQYCIDNDGAMVDLSGTGTSNNLSDSITFADGPQISSQVQFIDIAGDDFHLYDTPTNAAYQTGKDMRTLVDLDIDDDWRQIPMDMGADQIGTVPIGKNTRNISIID
jgi:hypothetical protein